MLFAIDVVFIDHRGAVIEARRSLRPGLFARSAGAGAVLELPPGSEVELSRER
jgi:uncharacterized membrane protein (UPF0127 family)